MSCIKRPSSCHAEVSEIKSLFVKTDTLLTIRTLPPVVSPFHLFEKLYRNNNLGELYGQTACYHHRSLVVLVYAPPRRSEALCAFGGADGCQGRLRACEGRGALSLPALLGSGGLEARQRRSANGPGIGAD